MAESIAHSRKGTILFHQHLHNCACCSTLVHLDQKVWAKKASQFFGTKAVNKKLAKWTPARRSNLFRFR